MYFLLNFIYLNVYYLYRITVDQVHTDILPSIIIIIIILKEATNVDYFL